MFTLLYYNSDHNLLNVLKNRKMESVGHLL